MIPGSLAVSLSSVYDQYARRETTDGRGFVLNSSCQDSYLAKKR